MEVLAEYGLSVPEDISIAGFDDTLLARMAVPKLTTVRQPFRKIGVRAVELLLEHTSSTKDAYTVVASQPSDTSQSVFIDYDLQIRGSVSTPRHISLSRFK
jgi:DNA-binding LacI/PurR family transcriptional regulator